MSQVIGAHMRKGSAIMAINGNQFCRVLWRSLIDVDLIGINDPPDVTTTSSLPYYCGAGV